MKVIIAVAAAVALACFATPAAGLTDVDVLNFALNLEYLEAEFYQWAVFGKGIPAKNRLGGPASSGGRKTPLSSFGLSIAKEIATDELDHVVFLQLALGKAAVKMPKINIGTSFADAADIALGAKLNPRFSPYRASSFDLLFLHGAFIFEDVGVTAYAGAAKLIASKGNLEAAARILAVEAYHAGTVRTLLFQRANTKVAPYGVPVRTIIAKIAQLRGKLGGGKEQGVIAGSGWANIVPTNGNGLAFTRSAQQVLSIVCFGTKGNKGGFFPNGLNGNIK